MPIVALSLRTPKGLQSFQMGKICEVEWERIERGGGGGWGIHRFPGKNSCVIAPVCAAVYHCADSAVSIVYYVDRSIDTAIRCRYKLYYVKSIIPDSCK
jgi:hypothetical protein